MSLGWVSTINIIAFIMFKLSNDLLQLPAHWIQVLLHPAVEVLEALSRRVPSLALQKCSRARTADAGEALLGQGQADGAWTASLPHALEWTQVDRSAWRTLLGGGSYGFQLLCAQLVYQVPMPQLSLSQFVHQANPQEIMDMRANPSPKIRDMVVHIHTSVPTCSAWAPLFSKRSTERVGRSESGNMWSSHTSQQWMLGREIHNCQGGQKE